jgi:hypothetical protein
MIQNEIRFFRNQDWLLVSIGTGIFALALWMTVEAVVAFGGAKQAA